MNRKLKSKIVLKFGTQADFAEAINEHEPIISAVIRGRREISNVKKMEWALALRCKPEEIFEEAN